MINLKQLVLACLSSATLGLMAPAHAQSAPVIRAFTVQQVSELSPGTELEFKLNGTPSGQATVAIEGTSAVVTLSETKAGNYTGAYTISLNDQLTYKSAVKASLRVLTQETHAALDQTLLTASAHNAAVAAATPNPVIDFFGTEQSGLTGGHQITFHVKGTPGAQTTLTLSGSDARIALAETKPGEYSGSYTIRSRDRIKATSVATTTLALGSKTVKVTKALSAQAVQPTLAARQSCESCGVVQSVDMVEVQGDPGYVGAIAGGVAGAVLGNQVGNGDGRTAARLLGAVGGAFAGREIEKRVTKTKRYNVNVKLHSGAVQTVQVNEDPGLKNGQQVKISDGRVVVND